MHLRLWLLALLAAAAAPVFGAQRTRLNPRGSPLHGGLASRAVAAARTKGHLIVSTADGYLHRIDVGRGEQPVKRWSTSIGSPMIASYQSPHAEMQSFAVVPAVDGSILIRTPDGVRRIPMKARMIADRTPFVANDGTMYTGSKKSRIIAMDINTGLAVQEVSDEGAALAQVDIDRNTVVWFTRVDVAIRAFSATGVEQWNVTFSEVLPLTSMMGQGSDIARPPDPLVATPEGELVYSDPNSRTAFTIPLSAPATGAFSLTNTMSLESLPSSAPVSTFTTHQLDIVYRAPKTAEIDSHAYNAVVRSLDNQLYAVVLAPQTSTLPDTEPSSQLSTIVRPDLRTTSPLINHRNMKEPRTWLSWLHQQSTTPLTPVFLGDEDQATDLTASECADVEEVVDSSCLLGVHPIIPDSGMELSQYDMDPTTNYEMGWPYPALPFDQHKDNTGAAVDVYRPSIFGPRHPMPVPSSLGATRDWWTLLNQASTMILLLLVMAFGVVKWWPVQVHSLLKKLGASDLVAQRILSFADSRASGAGDSTVVPEAASNELSSTDGEEEDKEVTELSSNYQIEITDDVLGYGAHGTIVFRGKVDNRPVAVKRMVKQYSNQALREIKLLIQSDGHPHVVRYYLKEERQEFVFLALQLCETSLHKFVSNVSTSMAHTKLRRQNPHLSGSNLFNQLEAHRVVEPRDVQAPPAVRRALLQAAEGVAHLHSLRIVHRDVKPQNILLAAIEGVEAQKLQMERLEHLAQFTLKISDMGLGKQLDAEGNSTSLSMQAATHGEHMSGMSMPSASLDHHPVGTVGWQAPELMIARRQIVTPSRHGKDLGIGSIDAMSEGVLAPSRHSEKVDIFSLGCVIYFVLVPMEHPFGEWFDRESNIMHNHVNLSKLEHIPDAHDLVSKMVQHQPTDRPTAAQVCRHPFFWSEEKRLSFLLEFSDRLEKEDVMSPLVLAVESNAANIVGASWEPLFHTALLEDVAKYRKYDTSSVRDCLRLIRNKRHHFHELPTEMKQQMSPIPSGFLWYFESRLPRLLMHCVKAACQHLALERDFAQYCFAIAPLYQRSNGSQPSEPSASPATSESPAQNESSAAEEKAGIVLSEQEEEKKEESKDGSNTNNDDTNAAAQSSVVLWSGSALTEAQNCRGWWRPSSTWTTGLDVIKKKSRPAHLQRATTDARYRTRLCTHWETTGGQACPMRKKGKCDFAHGPLELRVKENRRNRWGVSARSEVSGPESLRLSGGEDPLGAARSIEQVRLKEGSLSEFERSTKERVNAPAGTRSNNSQPRRPRGK